MSEANAFSAAKKVREGVRLALVLYRLCEVVENLMGDSAAREEFRNWWKPKLDEVLHGR